MVTASGLPSLATASGLPSPAAAGGLAAPTALYTHGDAWRSDFENDAQRLLEAVRDSLSSMSSLFPKGTQLPYVPPTGFGALLLFGGILTVMHMISYSSIYRKLWLNSWYLAHGAPSRLCSGAPCIRSAQRRPPPPRLRRRQLLSAGMQGDGELHACLRPADADRREQQARRPGQGLVRL